LSHPPRAIIRGGTEKKASFQKIRVLLKTIFPLETSSHNHARYLATICTFQEVASWALYRDQDNSLAKSGILKNIFRTLPPYVEGKGARFF
jgi:hypothetical protein